MSGRPPFLLWVAESSYGRGFALFFFWRVNQNSDNNIGAGAQKKNHGHCLIFILINGIRLYTWRGLDRRRRVFFF